LNFNHSDLDDSLLAQIDEEALLRSRNTTSSVTHQRATLPKPISTYSPLVPPTNMALSDSKSYPWSKDIARINSEVFGHHGFRTNQLEAINATMAGHNVFVLMPTGNLSKYLSNY